MNLKGKKAQVTIFVVAALVLVGAIALFFAFRQASIGQSSGASGENPVSFFESCIDGKVRGAVGYISLRGGYIDGKPSKEFQFQNEPVTNITYLCYNQNSYLPCINQRPTFMDDLRREIKDYVSNDVGECFMGMEEAFKKEAYEVSIDYRDFNVSIVPGKITLDTDSEITLTKAGQATKEEDVKADVASKLYEISFIVQEIVNQEARFCYAEASGISVLYPEFMIDKTKTSDLSNIYTIEHRESREKFRFAVRSCAIPPTI
jgi:hypothetical protein